MVRALRRPSSTAARFAAALPGQRAQRPAPLPTPLRPLAAALAAPRAVSVSSGAASAKALAAVGKRAATVGSTIHLPEPPERTPLEVLAHELVHAAHPSAAVRFFDDDRHDREETTARRVGRLARTLTQEHLASAGIPNLRTAPVGGPAAYAALGAAHAWRAAPGGAAATGTGTAHNSVAARNDGAATRTGRSQPLEVFTARAGLSPALARALTEPARPPALRHDPAAVVDARSSRPAAETVRRRFSPPSSPAHHPAGLFPPVATPHRGVPVTPEPPSPPVGSTAPLAEETIEWIIEQVEQRVLDELDRRGLRYNPGVL
jgi:hypothetical protein